MAVKASANITISFIVDVKATYRYYKLQASTESTPSVPTTSPPSGWTSTEPSYEDGSTNTLYFVDQTVFTNDTFIYSEVSKSTSYEAAKLAYNKAINAQNTANNAAKVATNYINYTSGTGLVVGDMTTNILGKNTIIDANGMAVRDNETELSRFGANEIELGKNNSDTTISMRNGNVVIENLDRGGLNYTRIGSYGNFDVSSIENISTDKFRRGGILTTIEANDRAEWQYFMQKTWNELRSYKWNELNTDIFASSFGTYFETRIYADNNDQEAVNGFNTARIFLRTASDPSNNRIASEMGLEADKIKFIGTDIDVEADTIKFIGKLVLPYMMPVGYIFQWVPTDGGPDLSTASKVAEYFGFGTWEQVATRSNSIYGNSDTVQPPALFCYMWKRIA